MFNIGLNASFHIYSFQKTFRLFYLLSSLQLGVILGSREEILAIKAGAQVESRLSVTGYWAALFFSLITINIHQKLSVVTF